MPQPGDSATATLTVDPYDATTAAALTVVAPDGTTGAASAATGDGGHTWTATVHYPAAGLWRLVWQVTGTGAGTQLQTVAVDPGTPPPLVRPAAGQPARWRTYATSEDLAVYLQETPPADADRRLRDATVMIDRLLLSAIYEVDDNDMPTDPKVAVALREATCEQVNWWIQTGDPDGARGAFQSMSIGGITVAAAAGTRTGPHSSTRIGPQVISILENAGLLGQPPVTW